MVGSTGLDIKRNSDPGVVTSFFFFRLVQAVNPCTVFLPIVTAKNSAEQVFSGTS